MTYGYPMRPGGLSLQTLVLASMASLVAALVTSVVWSGGTLVTAAVTPVIVSLATEVLRGPVAAISRVPASIRRYFGASSSAATPEVGPDEEEKPDSSSGAVPEESAPGQRSSLQGQNLRRGLVTGLLGFAIAAIALTVPELVAGESVGAENERTTLFGGSPECPAAGPRPRELILNLSRAGGRPGTTVEVSGGGADPQEIVAIKLEALDVYTFGHLRADDQGCFSGQLKIPEGLPGGYKWTVFAQGDTSQRKTSTSFNIQG